MAKAKRLVTKTQINADMWVSATDTSLDVRWSPERSLIVGKKDNAEKLLKAFRGLRGIGKSGPNRDVSFKRTVEYHRQIGEALGYDKKAIDDYVSAQQPEISTARMVSNAKKLIQRGETPSVALNNAFEQAERRAAASPRRAPLPRTTVRRAHR